MRSRICTTAGVHVTLVLMSHAVALGCSPGARSPGTEGPSGSGKGDHADAAGPADVACTSSFDCSLDQMCNTHGQCVPWDAVEFGETSPMHLRLSPDEPEGPECTAWEQPSSPELDHYVYLQALSQTGRVLYGDGESDGVYMRRLREMLRLLNDEEWGRAPAEKIQHIARSFRDVRDAARAARARYEARFEEITAAEESLKTALTFRPGEAERETLEYLRGLYDLGVRVVVSHEGEWTAHPMYAEAGIDFRPALDASAKPLDGLYYVDEAELRRVLRQPDGASHFRGASRLFQARQTIAVDAAWLREADEAVGAVADNLLEDEVPSRGGVLEDYLDASIEEFRLAYSDVLNAQIQTLGTVAAEFHRHDLQGDVWGFAQDHPELRTRTLAERPDMFQADCELAKASAGTGADAAAWLVLAGIAGLTGTALWFQGTLALAAAIAVVSLAVVAIVAVAAVGALAVLWYLDEGAPPEDAASMVENLPRIELYGPVFRAVAEGTLSLTQAALLLDAARQDRALQSCLETTPAAQIAETCA